MELLWYDRQLKTTHKSLVVVPISDAHYGNPFFSKRHFIDTLYYVRHTPNVYAICNGDLCESSIRTSKGDIFKQVGTPQDQRDWVIKQLKPIRHKILGMTTGNHEDRIYRETGVDISKDIALVLTAFIGCYFALGLYLAAFATSLTAICWYILYFRRK